jgi:pyruvate dehydrogenase E2 component (dihydrolipoamide acetyltransferase)
MIEVKLPKIREDVDESVVVIWFVSEGDQVKEGDPLLEIQTEKEVTEIEAEAAGTIKEIVCKRGESAKVGEVLATIDPEGNTQETKPEEQKMVEKAEPEKKVPAEEQQPEEQKLAEKAEEQEPAAEQKEPAKTVRLAPGLRKLARELNVPLESIAGTGRNGKITEKDIRRVAGQLEVMEAAGKTGALKEEPITKEPTPEEEIEEASKEVQQEAPEEDAPKEKASEEIPLKEPAQEESPKKEAKREEEQEEPLDEDVSSSEQTKAIAEKSGENQQTGSIPLSGIRGVIARRMTESLQNSAQLTETAWADVTKLEKRKDKSGKEVGWTVVIAKAAAQALSKHPILNAHIKEDHIIRKQEINLGFAVDTDKGLQVAVLREAGKQSPAELQKILAELAEKARAGKLSNQESTGSTFTITSLGAYRIQFFTPIVNPPEVAILGIGQIENYLVLKDGKVQERKRLPLSLTIDHRAVDGAPAAKFLEDLIELLEKPKRFLKDEKRKEKKKKKNS